MRILVTGSRGLLGHYLLAELERHGHAAVEFDLVLGDDVRDSSSLVSAVQGADAVVHLASPSSSILFDADPDGCWTATLAPLETLLRTSCVRLVVPSSGTVYGGSAPPSSERSWLRPVRSAYASAKLESERLALHARSQGRDVSICRVFTGYGGHEHHKTGYASQPFAAMDAAVQGLSYDIFGSGNQSRDFVHALDIARALRLMVEKADVPPLVNVGSGVSTTVNEMVAKIGSAIASPLAVRHVPAPAAYVEVTRADLSLARSALGFIPQLSVEDGLREVYASFTSPDRS